MCSHRHYICINIWLARAFNAACCSAQFPSLALRNNIKTISQLRMTLTLIPAFLHPAFMKCLHVEDKTIATPRHNIEILPTTKVSYTNVRLNTGYRTGHRSQVLCGAEYHLYGFRRKVPSGKWENPQLYS